MHVQSQSVDRSDFLMKLKRPKRYLMITRSLKSITDSAMSQSDIEVVSYMSPTQVREKALAWSPCI